MTDFGDFEPEDAWHPDDPVPVLVFNLLARLDVLDARRDGGTCGDDLIDLLDARVRRWRRRRVELSERDRVRVAQLTEDLEHVKARRGH